MNLSRYALANRFDDLRREMDRLFDSYGTGRSRRPFATPSGFPAMNVWDAGDTVCVEAEIPGISKEDFEIYAVGKELTVKGCRPPMEGKLTYHRQERGTGEFTRVITLPVEINADKVEAVLADGVLTLHLPKAEMAKRKQITVKAD